MQIKIQSSKNCYINILFLEQSQPNRNSKEISNKKYSQRFIYKDNNRLLK